MKQLICEMCGGTDLIKKDGVFVCQSCGTKYSVEEAKKMMIEGTVEIIGTVNIDNTSNLDKILQNANRARINKNYELAEKYYIEVMDISPNNWMGMFYSTYCKTMQGKIKDIKRNGCLLNNCIKSVLSCIKETVSTDEQKGIIQIISKDLKERSENLCYNAIWHYKGIGESIRDEYFGNLTENLHSSADINFTFADELTLQFHEDDSFKQMISEHYRLGISQMLKFKEVPLTKYDVEFFKKVYGKKLQQVEKEIIKYDSNYQFPFQFSSNPEVEKAKVEYQKAYNDFGPYQGSQLWALLFPFGFWAGLFVLILFTIGITPFSWFTIFVLLMLLTPCFLIVLILRNRLKYKKILDEKTEKINKIRYK